ncbi:MAG: hypothetical protein CMF22_12090 [Idiomarinaceae bacterium]|nr:hypothetical protein [Idiomarinaceae bacterium]|tara:strand:+ start:4528 stop:4773 length:246 start_codon:yes stop_codon:yes gene_type:complete
MSHQKIEKKVCDLEIEDIIVFGPAGNGHRFEVVDIDREEDGTYIVAMRCLSLGEDPDHRFYRDFTDDAVVLTLGEVNEYEN